MAPKTKKKVVKKKSLKRRIKAAPDHPILDDADARLLNKEFERIKKKYGILRPELLLDEAQKSKKLEGYFEWDDSKAGHSFRLIQARKLIVAVHEIITAGNKDIVYQGQAWHPVTIATPEFTGKIRVPTTEAFSNPDFSEQLLAKAMKEARRFRAKYAGIVQLRQVFQAIGAVDAYMQKKMVAKSKTKKK